VLRPTNLSRLGCGEQLQAGSGGRRIPTSGTMPKDKRQKRDLHALDAEGMVLCNPRDKEAAHRAEMEGIATVDRDAVTCRRRLSLMLKSGKTDKGDTRAGETQ